MMDDYCSTYNPHCAACRSERQFFLWCRWLAVLAACVGVIHWVGR